MSHTQNTDTFSGQPQTEPAPSTNDWGKAYDLTRGYSIDISSCGPMMKSLRHGPGVRARCDLPSGFSWLPGFPGCSW